MSVSLTKIGLYLDGSHFSNASSYYRRNHARNTQLSIGGIRNFVTQRIAEEEAILPRHCRVVESHYFSGRAGFVESREWDVTALAKERVWDGILMREGVTGHYLPFSPQGEKGIDVSLALECFETAILKELDVVALVTGDSDFIPLVRKLNSRGVRVMVIGFTYVFQNQHGRERGSSASRALLNEANYPVAMDELVDGYEALEEPLKKLVDELFVRRRNAGPEDDEDVEPTPAETAVQQDEPASPKTTRDTACAVLAPLGDAEPTPTLPDPAVMAAATEHSAGAAGTQPGEDFATMVAQTALEPSDDDTATTSPERTERKGVRRYPSAIRRTPATRESLERLAQNGFQHTVEVVRPANTIVGESEMSRERVTGRVAHVVKGYGFIDSDWGANTLFFYHTDVENGQYDRLTNGTRVSYLEMKGERGLVAKDIQILDADR